MGVLTKQLVIYISLYFSSSNFDCLHKRVHCPGLIGYARHLLPTNIPAKKLDTPIGRAAPHNESMG